MNREILWRDTGLTPKIFILDARAVFPVAIWLFHWTWWTGMIAGAGVIGLYLVQRTGMSPMACLRQSGCGFWEQGAKRARLKSSGADAAAGKEIL